MRWAVRPLEGSVRYKGSALGSREETQSPEQVTLICWLGGPGGCGRGTALALVPSGTWSVQGRESPGAVLWKTVQEHRIKARWGVGQRGSRQHCAWGHGWNFETWGGAEWLEFSSPWRTCGDAQGTSSILASHAQVLCPRPGRAGGPA